MTPPHKSLIITETIPTLQDGYGFMIKYAIILVVSGIKFLHMAPHHVSEFPLLYVSVITTCLVDAPHNLSYNKWIVSGSKTYDLLFVRRYFIFGGVSSAL